MSTINRYQDILAWRKARAFVVAIYQLSDHGEFSKDFGLRNQIRRSAVSIMSNIAEGFERGGGREFLQFLYVAKGSASEAESQLYVALDQRYLTEKQFQSLLGLSTEVKNLLGGLIGYLKKSKFRGRKFARDL